jgi:hypothetical protein
LLTDDRDVVDGDESDVDADDADDVEPEDDELISFLLILLSSLVIKELETFVGSIVILKFN